MEGTTGSLSASKVDNDEKKGLGYVSPTGKPPPKPKVRRNIMLEKFRADVEPSLPPYTYTPIPFFFYGTLTDPLRLQEVLQLSAPPVLKPARVRCYKIMLWGQYPALVHGPMNNYVDGMAFVVETEEQQRKLEYYETDAYHMEGIQISVDGKVVIGSTFMWAHDPADLEEGTWSLEEWKKDIEEEMASHFRPLED
ncbi:hypothetical protein V495_08540 [Pseudogymnoascus sp. VKM F-4514 (FW-929)]|nr:hypothetical protein V495_08540 [Pseudogymnoascus sp. VKM F-4514 (FW-929)]KFY52023.1 hypothetical protein V497_08695 [Pseudogymnoascus sp. VKM F-4516 (FW-969)]